MTMLTRKGIGEFIEARLKETNRTLSREQIDSLIDQIMNMPDGELAQIGMEALHNEATCTGRFSCKKSNG